MKGFILACVVGICYGATWNHEGREFWDEQVNACHGDRQSPINIDNSEVYDEMFVNPITFANYDLDMTGPCINDDHTLKWTPTLTTTFPTVASDAWTGTYKFAQLHFHWGSINEQGSEHTIDGNEFPMEMHLVHYKDTYPDLATAAGNADGLLVIGIMFHIGKETNTVFQKFVDAADVNGVAGTTVANVELHELVDQVYNPTADVLTPGFYLYDGSLTTPDCNEVVTWVVMEETISITQAQIDKFRSDMKYTDGAPMVDNYRIPQPLNNRIVRRVIKAEKAPAPAP